MSPVALAELLDRLAHTQGVLISEFEHNLIVSQLDTPSATQLARAVDTLGWGYRIVDGADNPFAVGELCAELAPFRLSLEKVVPAQPGTLFLLTAAGFNDALARGHPADYWRLARLKRTFITQARAYGNWHQPLALSKALPTRSPRALVRETANQRRVPDDIRVWLLDETSALDHDDPLQQVWAACAFAHLSRSLANELTDQDDSLVFRGPPALTLPGSAGGCPDAAAFMQLQRAVRWVYEWSREAELRHAMLATEIARSGREASPAMAYLAEHLGDALDGARVVYQLHLSDVTVTTLNALGTLRGNVNDDAARTTESTQQALTKVAAALGVGLALIATGIEKVINPWLITLVMLVTCTYCLLELLAGWRLIKIRQRSRDAWQPRLYRFLPHKDYRTMVLQPATRSARVYLWTTLTGFALVVVLSAVVVACGFYREADAPPSTSPVPENQEREHDVAAPDKPPNPWPRRQNT